MKFGAEKSVPPHEQPNMIIEKASGKVLLKSLLEKTFLENLSWSQINVSIAVKITSKNFVPLFTLDKYDSLFIYINIMLDLGIWINELGIYKIYWFIFFWTRMNFGAF